MYTECSQGPRPSFGGNHNIYTLCLKPSPKSLSRFTNFFKNIGTMVIFRMAEDSFEESDESITSDGGYFTYMKWCIGFRLHSFSLPHSRSLSWALGYHETPEVPQTDKITMRYILPAEATPLTVVLWCAQTLGGRRQLAWLSHAWSEATEFHWQWAGHDVKVHSSRSASFH